MHIAERKRRITGTGIKDKTAVMGILDQAEASVLPWFRTARKLHCRPR